LGTIEALFAWLKATYDPRAILAGWGAIAVAYFVLHVFERVAPAEKGQKYFGMLTNGWITTAYLLLLPLAMFFPTQIVNAAVQWAGGPWIELNLGKFLEAQIKPVRMLLLLPVALVPIFVFDFFYYWFHRFQHTNAWLWEQHKLHHTDVSLNVTTSLRHHWTEEGLRAFIITIPMNSLLKISPVEAGVIGILIGQWGYFIHANLRLQLGPLTRVLVGPQAHRIHHSIEPHHIGKNLAAFFPIWDILFGTFHKPARNEFPATGVEALPSNPTVREALFGPFIAWWTMTSQRLGRSVSTRGE
jgi:sterol desaturase/sphingolipid hydroxylase (fatty acid hydroxylase superfamily)